MLLRRCVCLRFEKVQGVELIRFALVGLYELLKFFEPQLIPQPTLTLHSMKVPHCHFFIDHVEAIGDKLVPAEDVDPVDACGL